MPAGRLEPPVHFARPRSVPPIEYSWGRSLVVQLLERHILLFLTVSTVLHDLALQVDLLVGRDFSRVFHGLEVMQLRTKRAAERDVSGQCATELD